MNTGLHCLAIIANLQGLAVDIAQLQRLYGSKSEQIEPTNWMQMAKELTLKAKLFETTEEAVRKLLLPCVAILKNGNYIVLIGRQDKKVLIIDPYKKQPFWLPWTNFYQAWNGQVLLVKRKKTDELKADSFGIRWFFEVFRKYQTFWLQTLFLSFVLQLLLLISPLFSQVIIDKVLVHRSLDTLDVLVGGMALVLFFQSWLSFLRGYLFTHTASKMDALLSKKLFEHVLYLPVTYFEKWQTGDVVSRVRELEQVRRFITGSALSGVLDTFFAAICFGVMIFYSPFLSAIVFITLLLLGIMSLLITPFYKKNLNRKFQANTENQTFLIETVSGIQTVKSSGIEFLLQKKWEDLLSRYAEVSFRTVLIANTAQSFSGLIQFLFQIAVLWGGVIAMMKGQLTVGEWVAFQMLAGQVLGPVMRLIGLWQYFQQTSVSIDRLKDILGYPAERQFNPNRTTLPKIDGQITIDSVTFRYRPEGRAILEDLSMTMPAGKKIGIVGTSGSGKSTLTKLIQRWYIPEKGRVLIDGVDLVQLEPAWLRRQIGTVLQENTLFHGTIYENITIACPEATEEQVFQAAQLAGAHDFIMAMPEQYQTLVEERGTSLSGGQRQRIAIARALIINPTILIFDEATSALDSVAENQIMNQLDVIARGRTMIMIAHRLSTVRSCDVIFVMEEGRIVESGSHEELMKKQGYYYKLCKNRVNS